MKFEVFGMDDCSYCDKAKDLLKIGGIKGSYTKLSREELRKRGYKTAPAVYLNGKYIGGFDEMSMAAVQYSIGLCEALHQLGVEQWASYSLAVETADDWYKNNMEQENE